MTPLNFKALHRSSNFPIENVTSTHHTDSGNTIVSDQILENLYHLHTRDYIHSA